MAPLLNILCCMTFTQGKDWRTFTVPANVRGHYGLKVPRCAHLPLCCAVLLLNYASLVAEAVIAIWPAHPHSGNAACIKLWGDQIEFSWQLFWGWCGEEYTSTITYSLNQEPVSGLVSGYMSEEYIFSDSSMMQNGIFLPTYWANERMCNCLSKLQEYLRAPD